MCVPFERRGEVDAEVPERGCDCGDVLVVFIGGAVYVTSNEVGIGSGGCEYH